MKGIRFIAGLTCMMVVAGSALAQAFPNKPLKVIIGYAAGGPTDLVARLVTQDMAARLGTTVVADNRPGASGVIALDALMASPPDGTTLQPLATPTVVSSILGGKAVDPATAFAPVGFIWDSAIQIEINPDAPMMSEVRSLRDLINVAKANPGKVYFTSAGTGSTGHLFGVRLGLESGVQWTHVGYKGLAPASVDMMAGRVHMVVGTVTNNEQMIKEGKIRVLAVSGPERDPRYPNAPSIVEAGFGDIAVTTWAGLITTAGAPKEIIDRLAQELRTTMQKPDLQAKIAGMAGLPRIGTTQEFATRVSKDYRDFARVIKEANIKVE